MKCPACDNRLSQREAGGVTVDVCKEGCGGIWFDNYEFEKFDEPHESEGETLLNVTKVNGFQVDTTARRNCPKCPGIVMARHFVSVKRHVEIDECPGCGGIWLDAGELHQIRSLFRSEGDRKQAANSYFQEVFSNDLLKMQQESREKLGRAKRFSNIFRFLTPSYYIPGNQTWGAY